MMKYIYAVLSIHILTFTATRAFHSHPRVFRPFGKTPDSTFNVKTRLGAAVKSAERPALYAVGSQLLQLVEDLDRSGKQVNVEKVRSMLVDAAVYPNAASAWQWARIGAVCTRHFDMDIVDRMAKASIAANKVIGRGPSIPNMTRIVDAASKAKRWDMVAELLETMQEIGAPPNAVTYCAVLSSMAKAGEHKRISNLLKSAELGSDIIVWNAIISGLAGVAAAYGRKQRLPIHKSNDALKQSLNTREEHYEVSMYYFNKMVEAGVKPNAMTFSTLIAAARDGAKNPVARADEIVNAMQDKWEVTPDVYCLNNLMALYMTNGHPQRALNLLRAALHIGKGDSWGGQGGIFKGNEGIWGGVSPDLYTYNTGISACERLADGTTALILLRRVLEDESVKPDKITYNSVISALGRAAMWPDALALFKEMTDADPNRGLEPDTLTYNSVISALARGGEPTLALAVFNAMESKSLHKDEITYGAALHACMRGMDGQRAESIIRTMRSESIRISPSSYASAIFACLRSDREKEALDIYEISCEAGTPPVGKAEQELMKACTAVGLGAKADSAIKSSIPSYRK